MYTLIHIKMRALDHTLNSIVKTYWLTFFPSISKGEVVGGKNLNRFFRDNDRITGPGNCAKQTDQS